MALDIWSTDPNNKPKPRETFSDDTVGRFVFGITEKDPDTDKDIPTTLSEWLVRTGDPTVADRVAKLLGGEPVDNGSAKELNLEVFTKAPKVRVIVDNAKALYSDMKRWHGGKLVHHCTGTKFLSPDDKKGKPCGCPELFAERKQAAEDGIGPKPAITLTFRLADDLELGYFKFQSSAWGMAKILHEYENSLAEIEGAVALDLAIEYVEFTIKKGPKKGLLVQYYRAVLDNFKASDVEVPDAAGDNDEPGADYSDEAPF